MDKLIFQPRVIKLAHGLAEILSVEYKLAVFDGNEEKKQEQIKRLNELTTGKTVTYASISSDDYVTTKLENFELYVRLCVLSAYGHGFLYTTFEALRHQANDVIAEMVTVDNIGIYDIINDLTTEVQQLKAEIEELKIHDGVNSISI